MSLFALFSEDFFSVLVLGTNKVLLKSKNMTKLIKDDQLVNYLHCCKPCRSIKIIVTNGIFWF